ncbi:MAG: phosphate/phosphite/phosphonate ABC transporter substrate-binding protein [Tepidisphaeraceae bacterium]
MTEFSTRALTMAGIAMVVMCLLGFAYFTDIKSQIGTLQRGIDEEETRQTRLTGLSNPKVVNTLNPRYTDADGDLIADCPRDPSRQIDPLVLKFSYIPQEDNSDFENAFKELVAAIGRATGRRVEYSEFASADEELLALREGRLQIAGFNTGAVPAAVCQAGFVPMVQMANDGGVANYRMQLIVSRRSHVRTIEDIRGHELTLTEPTSNSGYKAPLVLLRDHGLVPPRDYLLRFSQGHLASIHGIEKDQFEIAAVAEDVLEREVSAGAIHPGEYRTIYTSQHTFPAAAIGCAYNLKPELAAKIKDVLLTFDWQGTGLARDFGAEGKSKFVPVNYKDDWAYVRQIDDSLGFSYEVHSPLALAH